MTVDGPSLTIVENFANLLQQEDYDAVADMLHDDCEITPPPNIMRAGPEWIGKDEWLAKHRSAKARPVYGYPEPGEHDKQVKRRGRIKLAPMMAIGLIQTIELDDDGKIIKIMVKKA